MMRSELKLTATTFQELSALIYLEHSIKSGAKTELHKTDEKSWLGLYGFMMQKSSTLHSAKIRGAKITVC